MIATLKVDLPLGKAIEYVAGEKAEQDKKGRPFDEFTLSHLLASMSGLLLIGFDEAKSSDSLLLALEAFHSATRIRFLTLSESQVNGLCRFLCEIETFLGTLTLGTARLFLIDLPVGNSLPMELLRTALAQTRPVTVLRSALSRNDSKRAGITRRELLTELISAENLRPNDVVVFLDEWNTGSNFHNLSSLLQRTIPAGSFFLPAAMLSGKACTKAPLEPRYATFCKSHDSMLPP